MAHAPTPAMLLRADVRLFGDILGRVLKAEEGEAVFEAIEAIRQASVAYHREGTPERGAEARRPAAGRCRCRTRCASPTASCASRS